MSIPESRSTLGLDHTIPGSVRGPEPQNPAPMSIQGQVDLDRVRTLADQITTVFLNSLPSNYVSEVGGPYYVQQFQAAAEELARIQILAMDAYEDNDYDFTRTECLFQFLATLVFPDAETSGLPTLQGDITYREFLKRMVALLLQGSKTTSLVGGIEALTDAEVSLLERVRFVGKPGVGWTGLDQFIFDVDISKHRKTAPTSALSVASHYHPVSISSSGNGTTGAAIYDSGSGPDHTHGISNFVVAESHGTGQADHTHPLLSDFPDLPIILQRNVSLVLQALDPAHSLYEYRNLFREVFTQVFSDTVTQFDLSQYKYEDVRKDWQGFQGFSGTRGICLTDRYLFRDPYRSFRHVRTGSTLTITSGLSSGVYTVSRVLSFPFGDDPTPRPYTTTPTGLSGSLTIVDGAFVDPGQNFGLSVVGETLTLTTGPNAGTYPLETILGSFGGPIGVATGPATRVLPAPSVLRVTPKFPASIADNVPYTVTASRLGAQQVRVVTGEDVSTQFYLPGTFSQLYTANGPLVRTDGTPATAHDVTVSVDGAPVSVSSVNPYLGLITLTYPVAGFAPGAKTVLVSYSWFRPPVVGLTLNRQGLTLNRWDLKRGHNTSSPVSGGLYGGRRTSRFQAGVVLGTNPVKPQPLRVAHRYIAFEKGYTSGLNSPLGLRLNQAPGRFTVPYATADIPPVSITYEGTEVPQAPWVSVGAVVGTQSGDTYTLDKSSSSEVAYWKQDFPLPVSSVVAWGARVDITNVPATDDGVFSGVGVAFHNNRRLYLAGALTVRNPVSGVHLRHIGILARPGDLSSASSWVVGPYAEGTIRGLPGTNVITFPPQGLPTLLKVGDRFQIVSGGQTGTYTVQDLYRTDTLVTLVTTSPFPADPGLWGNHVVTVLFEAKWDSGPCTWRLYADTSTDACTVFFGGPSGAVVSLGTRVVASPAYLGPDVLPEGYGRLLWGSFSRPATSTSSWDFVRSLATPNQGTSITRETVVDALMGADPEDGPWYTLTPFGDSAISAGTLRLTSTPAESGLGTTYGYAYTDPFLDGRRVAAFDATVSVTRDTSGAGGAAIVLQDPHREIRLGSLLYRDLGSSRVLYRTPTVSLVGAVSYGSQGWSSTGVDDPGFYANGPNAKLSSTDTQWAINTNFVGTGPGRFLEFRLAIDSYTLGATSRLGLSFEFDLHGRSVTVDFRAGNEIVLRSTPTSAIVITYSVPWSDGATRTYRLEYDGLSDLTFYVDNTQVGVAVPMAMFPLNATTGLSLIALRDGSSSFSATLSSLCLGGTTAEVLGLGRTFGIWLGGDPDDINNWKIPRSDGTSAPNSDPLAIPVSMDWTSDCWVRLFLDPTFGVSFIRPDLNPPPGYTGDFATQSMNPSAGWVTLEYQALPRLPSATRFGSASFGNLNPSASTIQFWKEVRYRVFSNTTTEYSAPRSMVLNRWNVITSGDYLKDKTPEEVLVASVTTTRVSLRPCGIFADRVFSVTNGNTLLPPGSWHFNRDTQDILLDNPLPVAGTPIGVVFAPGQPVGLKYLQSQPLVESQTILNDGTPPVPRGQVGVATIHTVSGDGGPTPSFPPATPSNPTYFLRDQYLTQQFQDSGANLYAKMGFLEIEDSGFRGGLAVFDDGGGAQELGFSGSGYTENFTGLGSAGRGRGPGVYRSTLGASGGTSGVLGFVGPALYTGPFTTPNPTNNGLEPAMLYPTGPSGDVVPGSDSGAIYRELFWVLRLGASPGSVLSDGLTPPYVDVPLVEDFSGSTSDVDYASEGPALISPSAVGLAKGSAWSEFTYPTGVSFLGPWSGYVEDLGLLSFLYGASALQPTGIPASGYGLELQGGAPLPDPPVPVVGIL